ncbi:hypothetical protein [Streptomyces sp. AK02-01A]|uniref:hypothetical protein n=1 Tax=Streptomyces sp. AK02-01A TaxID=3028648 RepID=UPI0029B3AFDF|nr:hypothetical protein [Streptomyces sp. AK02-01A]MDX3854816.1 hypothetical protein [Streptomyces sp. AK02-01A]
MEVVDRYSEERVAVAQNKTVPLAVLEIVIDDPDARVRFMVAIGMADDLSSIVERDVPYGQMEVFYAADWPGDAIKTN